jgi:alpha-ketoglutarate-dependent taurine dioxygenase
MIMTAVLEKTRLKTELIKDKIGGRVLNTKEELLTGRLSDEIMDLLEQRGVLVFPQVHFTDAEQIAFTGTLGCGFAKERTGDDVMKISLEKGVNHRKIREYLLGSLYWHIDGTMNEVPIRGSILSSKVLPPWGGNTEFANCYAAYDDLPEARKREIDDLRVIHSMWASQLYHCPEPALEQLDDWMQKGELELPLVWKHRSGRNSLVLGNTAERVLGVSHKESARILHGLREWATGEPYHYSHEWRVGDAVMWDNTGTLHRATPYDPDCGRLLHRTILKGDEPFS